MAHRKVLCVHKGSMHTAGLMRRSKVTRNPTVLPYHQAGLSDYTKNKRKPRNCNSGSTSSRKTCFIHSKATFWLSKKPFSRFHQTHIRIVRPYYCPTGKSNTACTFFNFNISLDHIIYCVLSLPHRISNQVITITVPN